jgi:hypothetical protein
VNRVTDEMVEAACRAMMMTQGNVATLEQNARAILEAVLPDERPSDAEGEKLEPGELATELRHEAARQERSHFEPTPAQVGRAIQKLTAAADAIASLTAQRDALDHECQASMETIAYERHRAEAAEAEVARLRSTLTQILHESGERGMKERARASLQPSPTKTGVADGQ